MAMSGLHAESTTEQVDRLVDRAQSGHAEEALAEACELVARGGDRADASLFFACAVAADVLGDHGAAADHATAGVDAADRDGRDGWRAACLAMRALQLMSDGTSGPDSYDETQVMRDLAQAQVTLLAGVESTSERIAAYCNLAVAYTRLRLYELAVPMYLETTTPGDAKDLPPEAAVVQQLNLATLHLMWTLELLHVGLVDEAGQHAAQALDHCLEGERSVAGPHAETWAWRARLFAGCARAHGPDPLAGVRQVQSSLAALETVGADFERMVSTPHVGLALAGAGRQSEGLAVVDAAMARARSDTEIMVLAAIQRARLVLLAATSQGARAGLDLSRTQSELLWQQRARRLGTAEALLRYERLRAEHEVVAREFDLDPLTGTAARRALDRRMSLLAARPPAEDSSICVAVIDLDRFKTVNDSFGHQAGDLVLRHVGAALLGSLRDEDLVGRFGGDEFVALLDAEPDEGIAAADRMLRSVRAVRWPEELTLTPSISIGLAVTGPGTTLDQALSRADEAMYVAKRSGGDRVTVWQADTNQLTD